MNKYILFLLLSVCKGSIAQIRHFPDTIKYDLSKQRRLYAGLDGKNTIVSDLPLKLIGVQVGYIYNNRTSLYTGIYTTTRKRTSILENPTAAQKNTDSNTVYMKYGLTYVTFGSNYIFYDKKRFQLSANLALGLGVGHYKKYSEKKTYATGTPGILPLEAVVFASYKISWWVWFNAGLGTRISLLGRHDFNGPIYTYGFSLKLDAIYKKFQHKLPKEYRNLY